ncbi:hypothetical protein C0J52_08466 [Blattella germanica]|nr:hypothetical protein C0J52_08466 [Blattella germanica]
MRNCLKLNSTVLNYKILFPEEENSGSYNFLWSQKVFCCKVIIYSHYFSVICTYEFNIYLKKSNISDVISNKPPFYLS